MFVLAESFIDPEVPFTSLFVVVEPETPVVPFTDPDVPFISLLGVAVPETPVEPFIVPLTVPEVFAVPVAPELFKLLLPPLIADELDDKTQLPLKSLLP
jgi:hypothetical protein